MKHYEELVKDTEEAVDFLNRTRLGNKGRWFSAHLILADGTHAVVKNYDTYLQIMRVNGRNFPSAMDMKVGEWKKTIKEALEYERRHT